MKRQRKSRIVKLFLDSKVLILRTFAFRPEGFKIAGGGKLGKNFNESCHVVDVNYMIIDNMLLHEAFSGQI